MAVILQTWRGRGRRGVFADAAATAPYDKSAAENVERIERRGTDEVQEEGGGGSARRRAVEYDGEAVPEETWAKVRWSHEYRVYEI